MIIVVSLHYQKSKDMKTIDYALKMSCRGRQDKRIRNHVMKEEKEYIEKQEILDAIREGLLEIKRRRENGTEGITLQQFIDEL